MFGFLIGREVNDDAVRLDSLVYRITKNYMQLVPSALIERVKQDFDVYHRGIGDDAVSIMFPESETFLFHIYTKGTFAGELQCLGQGKYAGFNLHWTPSRKTVNVMDSLSYRATGGAKKLADMMAKKFGYTDISKYTREFSRL